VKLPAINYKVVAREWLWFVAVIGALAVMALLSPALGLPMPPLDDFSEAYSLSSQLFALSA
jgi:uncharacterized membrane protein